MLTQHLVSTQEFWSQHLTLYVGIEQIVTQTRSPRNRNKLVMNELSQDSFESVASPLHLQEPIHTKIPNVVSQRPA